MWAEGVLNFGLDLTPHNLKYTTALFSGWSCVLFHIYPLALHTMVSQTQIAPSIKY